MKKDKIQNDITPEISFGRMIKRLRKKFGYTQEKLVDKSNISAQTISCIENRGQNVKLKSIVLFAKAFDMTLEEFFSYFEECPYDKNTTK